jgi:hypothetical protein
MMHPLGFLSDHIMGAKFQPYNDLDAYMAYVHRSCYHPYSFYALCVS